MSTGDVRITVTPFELGLLLRCVEDAKGQYGDSFQTVVSLNHIRTKLLAKEYLPESGPLPTVSSHRKLKSYQRAEELARELRYQLSHASHWDGDKIGHYLLKWMRVTGKICYERPNKS